MRLIFDIETDGLLDQMTKIHCIVAKDIDSNEVHIFRPNQIDGGIKLLSQASLLIGHNIINFDIRAIIKLYPNFKPRHQIRDTLIMSRLAYPNLAERDSINLNNKAVKMNREDFQRWDSNKEKYVSAVGSHSLEAWGLRLKHKKGDYGKENDWSTFSEEMLEYCIQDLSVNHLLWNKVSKRGIPEDVLNLEMDIQYIIDEQSDYGWLFRYDTAVALYGELVQKRHSIESKLANIYTGWDELTKTPEYWYAKVSFEDNGEVHNVEVRKDTKGTLSRILKQRYRDKVNPATGKKWLVRDLNELPKAGPLKNKHIDFNASSNTHFAKVFIEQYGWKPVKKTETGKPAVDESVLKSFVAGTEIIDEDYREEAIQTATLLLEYEVLCDRIEKVAEGKSGGYIHFADDNHRIHGYLNTLGTATSRATHSRPNMAQVPANDKPYGKDFRGFFTVPKGYKLVGTDASSQELRILGHLLAPYDGGEFAREVVQGDVHTRNQHAMGLPTRDNAKTAIYAILYGAGYEKLGMITGGGVKAGKSIRHGFEANVPAYKTVNDRLKAFAKQHGGVIGIDGRFIPCSAEYRALNYVIQSAGAIIAKRWMWFIKKEIMVRGLDAHQVGWIHDELQFEVREDQAELLGQICKEAMKKVEKYYNFKCELDAEYKIGNDWSETH